jgi:hypothetical protein
VEFPHECANLRIRRDVQLLPQKGLVHPRVLRSARRIAGSSKRAHEPERQA